MNNIKNSQTQRDHNAYFAEIKPKSIGVSGIKLVKNATMFEEDGIVFCRHYDTIIFINDRTRNIVQAKFNCSRTSNRQIQYCLQYYNIPREDVINININNEKW